MHKPNLHGRLIRTFGRPLAEMGTSRLVGRLFALEGADGSGRSTNIKALSEWLEASGFAVRHMGLRRSPLLAQDIEHAKQSRLLTRTTMALSQMRAGDGDDTSSRSSSRWIVTAWVIPRGLASTYRGPRRGTWAWPAGAWSTA